jgi:glycosyltransferase involved in cell wall biosynthesis
VEVVTLPSLPTKSLDTVSHSAVTAAHLLARKVDCAIWFGVGNSPWAWVTRRSGTPTVLNVDGLDRSRAKWGRVGRTYLHRAERWAVGASDVLVTDAQSIRRYYADEYGAESTFIPYGGPEGPVGSTAALERFSLEPGGYVLYVSRLEPENNAHVVIEAHQRSGVELPLVVVGGATYSGEYEQHLRDMAGERVRFTGFVFGLGYAELQSHARVYVQATEVGGTHPALVEAMGYRNAVVALDTPEHREVLGDAGLYYRDGSELAEILVDLVPDESRLAALGEAAVRRAREFYSWDAVAAAYARAVVTAAAVSG